jgi:hypothetical protein
MPGSRLRLYAARSSPYTEIGPHGGRSAGCGSGSLTERQLPKLDDLFVFNNLQKHKEA